MVHAAEMKDFVIQVGGGQGLRWLSHDSLEEDGEHSPHPPTTRDQDMAYRTSSPREVQNMLTQIMRRYAANEFRVDVLAPILSSEQAPHDGRFDNPVLGHANGPAGQKLNPDAVAIEGDGPIQFYTAGNRWRFDRGAMPGEPFGFLDVVDDDLESAVAAIREVQVPAKGSVFEVSDTRGSLLSSASSPEEAATLAMNLLTTLTSEAAMRDTIDPTTAHGYAQVLSDTELQLAHQDALDSLFGERIVDVRNALFEAGWNTHKPRAWPLTKDDIALEFNSKHVGPGRNVVGGEWVLVRNNAPWAVLAQVQDHLTQSVYGVALEVDDAAAQAVERIAANRLLPPQELSPQEYAEIATVRRLFNHGRQYEVEFTGRGFGFSDAADPLSAVLDDHRRQVNNAVYAHSADESGLMAGTVFPSERALAPYPELKLRFADVFAAREVVSEGVFFGEILSVSDGIAVQKTNRNGNTVRHAVSSLNGEVSAGGVAEIRYHGGTGVVTPTQILQQGASR